MKVPPDHPASPSLAFPNSSPNSSFTWFLLGLFLSSAIILGTLMALSQLDFATVLLHRSLHLPLLEYFGDLGNHLGKGSVLVIICLALLIVGWVRQRQNLKMAGFWGLIAHALAGLMTQVLKHIIGRPRPRFTHQDPFQFGPSLQGGLDAFPSGHSSASFAVAAVLARFFPRGMWVWYGASIFVALSRVVRGSHFPTDVFAGALLGYLVGYVLVRNLRDWRASLVNALVVGFPFFVGAFGVVWVTFNQHSAGTLQEGMIGGGILVILLGCGVRWSLKREIRPLAPIDMIGKAGAGLMIAFGFAVFTESLVIVLLTILAASFWWLFRSHTKVLDPPHELRKDNRRWGHPSEIFILLGIGVALVVLHQLKGLVPLM